MPFIGEISALSGAFLWGMTALLFEEAGKRIGAFPTNLLRILLASIFLCTTLFFMTGDFLPFQATHTEIFWLGASGIVGLAIGDGALFISLVILGPRRATLLLSLAPPITATLAWFLLGERIDVAAIFGIAVTVWGIFWVVNEKHVSEKTRGSKTKGVILGIISALGQAVGLVLAKQGFSNGIDPLSATILRMLPAAATLWIFALLTKQIRPIMHAFNDKKAIFATLGGSVVGPYLGVWLANVAVKYTETGVASTLLATVPILVIPMVIIVRNTKPSARAVTGAIIAVIGVALLFLR
ncbi:MAG: EamA family transporter [Actinobacteria bacterium]|nr:EamA family transporter [Actinomycetota bacterium]